MSPVNPVFFFFFFFTLDRTRRMETSGTHERASTVNLSRAGALLPCWSLARPPLRFGEISSARYLKFWCPDLSLPLVVGPLQQQQQRLRCPSRPNPRALASGAIRRQRGKAGLTAAGPLPLVQDHSPKRRDVRQRRQRRTGTPERSGGTADGPVGRGHTLHAGRVITRSQGDVCPPPCPSC